jgi:hypothetical protein
VFGKDMKGQIERFAIDGIRVDAKFIQIWRARKVNVPQPPRREATLSYDHPAPHVKKDAYPGLPAVQM